jgi:hypothetical protein
MALESGIYAFSVRKSRNWRGTTQGISNLYHYLMTAPTETSLQNVLTALKSAEVPVHSTAVNFVEGRAWGPVQSNGRGGRMEAFQQLAGAGSAVVAPNMYLECCHLVVWPLGRYGTKNRPQFMRKWLHSGTTTNQTGSDTTGNTDISPATAQLITYINAVANLVPTGGGGPLGLQTASGHSPITAGYLYKYLEHRQFGR